MFSTSRMMVVSFQPPIVSLVYRLDKNAVNVCSNPPQNNETTVPALHVIDFINYQWHECIYADL